MGIKERSDHISRHRCRQATARRLHIDVDEEKEEEEEEEAVIIESIHSWPCFTLTIHYCHNECYRIIRITFTCRQNKGKTKRE